MIFQKVLYSKPEVIDDNGNVIKDMTEPSLASSSFYFTGLIMATDIHVMRPDTLTKTAFGNIEKTEEMLKGNAVSNPFAIEAGEIFMVPDIIATKQNFTSPGSVADIRKEIRAQYIDKSKAPDTTKMKEQMSAFDERQKTSLPPNYAKEGDKEMIIKDGTIHFGPNVTRPTTKQNDLKSVEDYIKKLKNNG